MQHEHLITSKCLTSNDGRSLSFALPTIFSKWCLYNCDEDPVFIMTFSKMSPKVTKYAQRVNNPLFRDEINLLQEPVQYIMARTIISKTKPWTKLFITNPAWCQTLTCLILLMLRLPFDGLQTKPIYYTPSFNARIYTNPKTCWISGMAVTNSGDITTMKMWRFLSSIQLKNFLTIVSLFLEPQNFSFKFNFRVHIGTYVYLMKQQLWWAGVTLSAWFSRFKQSF